MFWSLYSVKLLIAFSEEERLLDAVYSSKQNRNPPGASILARVDRQQNIFIVVSVTKKSKPEEIENDECGSCYFTLGRKGHSHRVTQDQKCL